MDAKNLLLIMADEFTSAHLGCAGHPLVKTPNLDKLAASGTRFRSAYTNGPICIPARASFATGRYTHEIGYWDNAHPYDGRVPGWGHALQAAGHRVDSIGKLHFRDADAPTGFDEQVLPMHVVNGTGDILGSVRDPLPVRHKSKALSEQLGPGETGYTAYDRQIADAAVEWLKEAGARRGAKPWVLFVSFVCPHFPLVAPEAFFNLYAPADMPLPKACRPEDRDDHPWIAAFRRCFTHDDYFDDDKRRLAIASYLGLCSFVDANVGQVLAALEDSDLARETRIIFLSDHGDNLGARGLWGKSTMFEESVGVPMILAGSGVPQGRVSETPVTLVDCHPTILECVGLQSGEGADDLPGQSLWRIADEPDEPDRIAFSEYHAVAAASGAFMIRKGRFKYVYYVGMAPQLFDLSADPEELTDLAGEPSCADVLSELDVALRSIVDPEETDRRAKQDQKALLARHGGREAVLRRGTFGATPAPSENASYESATESS